MRARLLLVATVVAGLAGCATATTSVPAGGRATATAATTAHSATAPSSSAAAAVTAPHAAAGTPSPPATAALGAGCGTPASPDLDANELTGIEFVSPSRGWAVGQGAILATTDGGAHWAPQLTGRLNLTAVDFVSASDGWAAGAGSLLATTDGGAHWARLAEPCPPIRSVHFTSATDGYAVAGGSAAAAGGFGTQVPDTGGTVLATHDGGHTWARLTAPANAQTVCFAGARDGWLGAGGQLYLTGNGGKSWTAATAAPATNEGGYVASMSVQCAGPGTAWAVRSGPGGGMSQQPHVAYHADASGVTAIYAEQYYRLRADPATNSPGAYSGPFSALSPSSAVFIDSCAPCGAGTAPWAVATDSGATLAERGNVGGITFADAAAFLSPRAGWVTGTYSEVPAKGKSRYQQRIVATSDGGKTWHTEWASPWQAQR